MNQKENRCVNVCPIEDCVAFLRALSDETRQQIIMIFVNRQEICVKDIANNFTLSRPTISHHLLVMKRSGLLISRKEGKEVHYSFNKPYVKKFMKSINDSLNSCC